MFELSPKEIKPYSFLNAIQSLVRDFDNGGSYERDVHHEAERQFGKSRFGGLLVPLDMPVSVSASGLDTKSSAAGDYTVAPQVRELIDLLRVQSRIQQLGAQFLPNLRGPISFPKLLTGSTATWVQENSGSDVAESDATFGLVQLSPKSLAATTSFSRELLAQSSLAIDQIVSMDLSACVSNAIDAAAINGSGVSNQPTGVLNLPDITVVSAGTTGAVPAFSHFTAMEAALSANNADRGRMGYLITPEVSGLCKTTARVSGQPLGTILSDAGTINGYTALTSNHLPKDLTKSSGTNLHAAIFGNWNDLVVANWGTLEVLVDQYRLKKQGMIEVTLYAMVDIAVRHIESFSCVKDFALS